MIMYMDHRSVKALGVKLKDFREARGLSQRGVAETLGYSTAQYISNFERGTCGPPIEKMRKLARLYRLTDAEIDGLAEDLVRAFEKHVRKRLS